MAYWLFKTEPFQFSWDDLKTSDRQTTTWDGIRNYQARNFLRDNVKLGDKVLFYHSRVDPPGIVGIAVVTREAYADPSAWNPKSQYFDAKSSPDNIRWLMVDVTFSQDFPRMVTLEQMKNEPDLSDMLVVKRGQRLSIQPVEERHFRKVCSMGGLNE